MDRSYRCHGSIASVHRLCSGRMVKNNPLVEYQTEGYNMFEDMIGAIEYDATRFLQNESGTRAVKCSIEQESWIRTNTGRSRFNDCWTTTSGSWKRLVVMIHVLAAVVKYKNCHVKKIFLILTKVQKLYNIIGYRRGGDGCLHLVLMNETKEHCEN